MSFHAGVLETINRMLKHQQVVSLVNRSLPPMCAAWDLADTSPLGVKKAGRMTGNGACAKTTINTQRSLFSCVQNDFSVSKKIDLEDETQGRITNFRLGSTHFPNGTLGWDMLVSCWEGRCKLQMRFRRLRKPRIWSGFLIAAR